MMVESSFPEHFQATPYNQSSLADAPKATLDERMFYNCSVILGVAARISKLEWKFIAGLLKCTLKSE